MKKNRKILAVDCGWGGAVAFWVEEKDLVDVILCPGDCHGVIEFLDGLTTRYGSDFEVYLEHNTASPHFGAVGNFGLGGNIASWETALSCHGMDWENIRPTVWQSICSREKSRTKKGRKMRKEKAWLLARRRFSQLREKLGDKIPSIKNPKQGMADALCILEWARRK